MSTNERCLSLAEGVSLIHFLWFILHTYTKHFHMQFNNNNNSITTTRTFKKQQQRMIDKNKLKRKTTHRVHVKHRNQHKAM